MVTIEGPFRPNHDDIQPHSKPELSKRGRGQPGWIPTWWPGGLMVAGSTRTFDRYHARL